jgi:hypothetical protein
MGVLARRWTRLGHRGLLRELDAAIARAQEPGVGQQAVPGVSGWSVHQHLERVWRADRDMVGWLASVRDGTAVTDGPGRTLPGTLAMWLGVIPRGQGRAPEFSRPVGAALPDIVAGFRAVRDEVAALGGVLAPLADAPEACQG